MPYLAGIDLGTSSLKVVIIDQNGITKAYTSCAYSFDSPVNGYAEQQAGVWWRACCECVKEALNQLDVPSVEIAGIGISGQMHGVVFLNENFQEVRPAILHCDARSATEVEYIKKTLGEQKIASLLYNPIYTGFLLPSLLWVRSNEPELYDAVRYIMLPKDYLRFCLTGQICSDYSDASATLAFDLERLCWSEYTLKTLDIPTSIFPHCYGTLEVVGKITAKASEQTGLPVGIPVINGGGDQIMQAIGNGVTQPGQATVNIGTSGQVCFQTDRLILNPDLNTNTFCGFEKNRFITMGATMSAGLSLKWFNGIFGKTDYDQLDIEVADIPPGSNGLIFLPYLMGERTPHLNPNISGMLWGLQTNTDRSQLTRSVMEGVAYSLRQCMETCQNLGGLECDIYVASGGGSRSSSWLQMQADIFNTPLIVADVKEHACLGAAIAAGVGVGIYQTIEQGCGKVVHYQDHIYYPDLEKHKQYDEYYQLYKQAFKASENVLEKITLLGRTSGFVKPK